jgi:hypothetical protein
MIQKINKTCFDDRMRDLGDPFTKTPVKPLPLGMGI